MVVKINTSASIDVRVGFLQQAAWFGSLPDTMQALVLATAYERSVQAGECIAHAGERSGQWLGVIHGLLQMSVGGLEGDETSLHCLRENEWGGEGSLLKHEARRYNIIAVVPGRICLIPADTFYALHREVVSFNHFLLGNLNERMAVAVGLLADARLCSPEQRVARCLLMLVEKCRSSTWSIPIQQNDLALICGLSRQRTNLALSNLKRAQLIRVDKYGLRILDAPSLQNYVGKAR